MAYKFMIGEARLSGSIVAEEGLTADSDSRLIASGSSSEIVLRDNGVNDVFKVDFANNEGRIQVFDNAGNVTFVTDDAEISGSGNLKIDGNISIRGGRSIGIGTDTDLMTLNNNEVAVLGTVKADSIASNNASNGLDIDGSSVNTGQFNVLMSHNLADALNFKSGSDSFIQFVTTAGSPKIVFGQTVEVTALSASGQITAGNFDADGAGAFGSVTTDTTIVAGTTVSGAGQLQGASVAVDGVVTAGGVVTGNSLVTAGNIGLSGDTDLISLTANSASVNGQLTVAGNLIVLGDTFSASVGTLVIEDALISIGDGQGTYADGYGIEFGSPGSAWAELKTAQVNSSNHLSSSLPIAAPSFYGDGTNLTGVTATAGGYTLRTLDLDSIPDGGEISITSDTGTGLYGTQTDHTASFFIGLSGTFSSGDLVIIKSNNAGADYPITILPSGSITIDGRNAAEGGIVLESAFAAVSLVYDGFGSWQII